MVLFAFLALLIIGAIAYFRDPKTFDTRSNIPLLVITVAVTTVLMITVKEPFGQKLLIFFSIIGTWHLAAEIMKLVGNKPEPTVSMRAFAGGHIENGKDEKTGAWIVRIIVALAAGLFIYYGYIDGSNNSEEFLYGQLHDGNALAQVGAFLFLACCAFFILIWNLTDKLIGITSSWPAKVAAVVGALGIILIYA